MDTGPRRQGLRDHRAGQDRPDPQLAADRSAPADRRSGRRHEVQGAPPRRRAEARGRAAEPDAHRRHRLRGREAARHAEAPGRRRRAATSGCATSCGAGRRCCSRAGTAQLAETIESARARLADAREREVGGRGARRRGRSRPRRACASSWSRPRRARPRAREAAHARELDDQPPAAADRVRPRSRSQTLDARGAERRRRARRARGAPRAGARWRSRRGARRPPTAERRARRRRGGARRRESEAYDAAHRDIEGLEADVEAARSEVFSAINSATALRHALEHAAAARERVGRDARASSTSKRDDLRIEAERAVEPSDARPPTALRRAQDGARGDARRARGARVRAGQRAHRARVARARRSARASTSSPALEARLHVARGARRRPRRLRRRRAHACSPQANGTVGQQGAVADYLEVDAGYERAVEACLGDLLQHVVVEQPRAGRRRLRAGARAGRRPLRLPRRSSAAAAAARRRRSRDAPAGSSPLSSVVARHRPVRRRHPRARSATRWIADSLRARRRGEPRDGACRSPRSTATSSAAPHLVTGGGRDEARGILATKREIKELRERVDGRARRRSAGCADEAAGLDADDRRRRRAAIAGARRRAAPAGEGDRRPRGAAAARRRRRGARRRSRRELLAPERARRRGGARRASTRRQDEARASIARLERRAARGRRAA